MAANHDTGHDLSLLDIGKQCSHPQCGLVDFLPIKCQHCAHFYCSTHFMPLAHKCEKYDEHQHNRIAPSCPFCQIPIAIPPGQDPNVRLERHFDEDCVVLTQSKGNSSSTNRCAKAKCGKVLFAPIRCATCKHNFCPQHRFPDTHTCRTGSSNVKATPSTSSPPGSRPNQSAASSASAMAAIKRALNNTTPTSAPAQKPKHVSNKPAVSKPAPPLSKLPPSASGQSTSSSSSRSNPFAASDRRAKAERESRLKAMREREKKGLLSEEEKVLLAQAEKEKDQDNCIIV